MTEPHEHRPTYFNFVNNKQVCRCKHCDKPLKCTNRWLFFLAMLPAFPVVLYLFREGLEHWPWMLATFGLCAILEAIAFRHLSFEVDTVQEHIQQRDFLRRRGR